MVTDQLKCDVCCDDAVGVASSRCGAISFAYCKRCLSVGAEPYGALVAMLAVIGGRDNAAPWVDNVVKGTLSVVGKTVEQLDADVAVEDERFMREMNDMHGDGK